MSFALSAVPRAARKPLVLAAALLTWLHMPSALAADLLQVYRDAQANDAQFASARSQLLATREKLPAGHMPLLIQRAFVASISISISISVRIWNLFLETYPGTQSKNDFGIRKGF